MGKTAQAPVKQRAFPWAREQRKMLRSVWDMLKEERELKRLRVRIDGRLFHLETERQKILRKTFPAASSISVEIKRVEGRELETISVKGK